MWIAIRAGILGIAKVIEKRMTDDQLLIDIHAELLVIADAIDRRYKIAKFKTV